MDHFRLFWSAGVCSCVRVIITLVSSSYWWEEKGAGQHVWVGTHCRPTPQKDSAVISGIYRQHFSAVETWRPSLFRSMVYIYIVTYNTSCSSAAQYHNTTTTPFTEHLTSWEAFVSHVCQRCYQWRMCENRRQELPPSSHVRISSLISCNQIRNPRHKSSWTPTSRTQTLDGTLSATWSWDTAASALCWWASAPTQHDRLQQQQPFSVKITTKLWLTVFTLACFYNSLFASVSVSMWRTFAHSQFEPSLTLTLFRKCLYFSLGMNRTTTEGLLSVRIWSHILHDLDFFNTWMGSEVMNPTFTVVADGIYFMLMQETVKQTVMSLVNDLQVSESQSEPLMSPRINWNKTSSILASQPWEAFSSKTIFNKRPNNLENF